jgi:hypothetical protein
MSESEIENLKNMLGNNGEKSKLDVSTLNESNIEFLRHKV